MKNRPNKNISCTKGNFHLNNEFKMYKKLKKLIFMDYDEWFIYMDYNYKYNIVFFH